MLLRSNAIWWLVGVAFVLGLLATLHLLSTPGARKTGNSPAMPGAPQGDAEAGNSLHSIPSKSTDRLLPRVRLASENTQPWSWEVDELAAKTVKKIELDCWNLDRKPNPYDVFHDEEALNRPKCVLVLDGEIREGDAAVIKQKIEAAPAPVTNAFLVSPGGSVSEALEIAEVLNSKFIRVGGVGTICLESECIVSFGGYSKKIRIEDVPICASACGFIYLLADLRSNSVVYLHRPYFDPKDNSVSSAQNSQSEYALLSTKLVEKLRGSGVPQSLIDQIMATPSRSAFRLADDYPLFGPAIEEWIASTCGFQPKPPNPPKRPLVPKKPDLPDFPPNDVDPSEFERQVSEFEQQVSEFLRQDDAISQAFEVSWHIYSNAIVKWNICFVKLQVSEIARRQLLRK